MTRPRTDAVSLPTVRLTLLHLTVEQHAAVMVVGSKLTSIAKPEDVAVLVLDDLSWRLEQLTNDADDMEVALPGLGEVHLTLDRDGGVTMLAVLHTSELPAWRSGIRYVTHARVLDTAWFAARNVRRPRA